MDLDKTPYKSGLTEFFSKFAHNTQLVIPVYQRNYTWTAAGQVEPFLNDIENVINGKFKTHFMGIIIYNVTKMSAINGNEYSIIDGQQRITTTIIMLYAIRDLLMESGLESAATKIEHVYLSNRELDDEMKIKLKPLVSDDLALKKIVEKKIDDFDEKDINSNVYKNYCKIKEWLVDIQNSYSVDDILCAINKLYIVAVPVDNNDYPQKIFESINSKGVSLTSSDLIRNYIFMGLDNKTQEKFYIKYWKEIEKNISTDSKKLEEYLRFYIASQSYELPSTKNNGVYHAFKKLLETKYGDSINDIANITETLESILRYSKYFNTIYYASLENIPNTIREAVQEYKKIDSNMPAPLFLRMFDYNSTSNEFLIKKVSDNDLSSIITITSNYLMRRALANLDTSDITRLFAPITREVLNEAKTIGFENIVEIYKKHLINKNQGKGSECPDNNKLRDSILANSNMYILKSTRILLDKLELNKNPAPVDLSKLSVEHLMPQTPTKEWLKYLNCSEEEYKSYLNRLGNLTLASKPDNSKMSNNPFTYKQEILADTNHLNINKKILQQKEWKFKQINDRTDYLIEIINELYPFESASNAILNKLAIYINTDDVIAEGIYDEDTHSVEVLPGSIVKKSKESYGQESQNQRLVELLEDGTIVEEDDTYVFKKDYTFYSQGGATALSTAAGFILHGSRNGWDYWKTSEGVKLCNYYKHGYKEDEAIQQDIIDKYWIELNSIILIDGKYQSRSDYHKKYFNFNIRKPYHGFIDFFNINDNLIKFGLWFDDKDKCFANAKLNIDFFSCSNYKYDILENEKSAALLVKREIPNMSDEIAFKKIVKDIYNEIDRIITIAKNKNI